ncbi:hypothetical protein [Silvibacterium acidisoli]|uniref:hypothetical protein n=1 Tax=Acidobacteriaceae bacterium ZG23-2 TaxID=2883246 RepID=UPI00406C5E5B
MAFAPTPLALESRAPTRGLATGLVRLWHLLSLDAPTVAALWAWGMARAVKVHLPWSAPLLLALGTWLLYIGDRILDGLNDRKHGTKLRNRHYFYIRHRRAFLAAGASGAALLIWLIATRMTPAAFHEDLILFTLALIYFGLIHLCGPAIERWFPKEMAVGLVFASATAVPAWSRLNGHRLPLVPLVAIFAALCWMNCAAIEKWESLRDTSTNHRPPPHRTTRWVQQAFQPAAGAVAMLAVCGATLAVSFGLSLQMTALYTACVLSELVLAGLDRGHLSAGQLRIAADAALLTPLLLLLIP